MALDQEVLDDSSLDLKIEIISAPHPSVSVDKILTNASPGDCGLNQNQNRRFEGLTPSLPVAHFSLDSQYLGPYHTQVTIQALIERFAWPSPESSDKPLEG